MFSSDGAVGVSLFGSLVDPAVRRAEGVRWADVVAWLCRPMTAPSADATPAWTKRAEKADPPNDRRKASLPLWSLVSYYRTGSYADWVRGVEREAPKRGKRDVEWVWGLGLDYDDGTTLAEMLEVWGAWAGVWHTTWKHREEAPRWRGVLPFAEPVHAGVWGRVFDWAQQRSGGRLDPATRDCSRAWYAPAHGPYAPFQSRVVRGPRLVVPDEVLVWREGIEWKDPDAERKRKAARRMPAPRRGTVPIRQAERVFSDRLKVEPGLRAWAGEALGGRAGASRVTGVRCPDCGRTDMWWPLEPKGTPKAMCSHRNSCNAQYWLDELIARAGVVA